MSKFVNGLDSRFFLYKRLSAENQRLNNLSQKLTKALYRFISPTVKSHLI